MKNKRLAERTAEEKNLVKLELDTLVRHGAQEILAKALEIEVELYLEKYQYILDEN